ncbi:hypothetical protein OTU49_009983, partial [Cherax quadricarinatus]
KVVVMGSIGTQTAGFVPVSFGSFVFISTIKNEDACTQCCLPLKNDASTSTDESAICVESFMASKTNCHSPSVRKRRGRPRKHPVSTEVGSEAKHGNVSSEEQKIETHGMCISAKWNYAKSTSVIFHPFIVMG